MPKHYHEFACDKCGDLFYAEWKRLCTLCDDYSDARAAAIAKLADVSEEASARLERALDAAIAKEGLRPWDRRPRDSMWSGHHE
jgi:hypothetical protein